MTAALHSSSGKTLRHGIEQSHHAAENHPLMQRLLSGAVTPALYRNYLAALLPLYETLERGIGRSGDPICRLFDRRELRRSGAIAEDIAWLTDHTSLPPMHECGVLPPAALRNEDPMALAAMAYLRYLGDLAGGQRLWQHLAEKLPMLNPGGLCFYEFELPAGQTAGSYLGTLRRSMLQCLGTEEAMDAFLEAANQGFEWHLSLFDDVWQGGSMNVGTHVQGLS